MFGPAAGAGAYRFSSEDYSHPDVAPPEKRLQQGELGTTSLNQPFSDTMPSAELGDSYGKGDNVGWEPSFFI